MKPKASRKWDDRFITLARTIAQWSKDPSTQVGAVIVDRRRRIVSLGFNGLPQKVADTGPRLTDRPTKLAITLHAETNAILFARRPLRGCTLYTWPLPPCSHCAALIIQSGIHRVVSPQPCFDHRLRWGPSLSLAGDLFQEAGVRQRYWRRP